MMEKVFNELLSELQQLLTKHRQLLDLLRAERDAIVNADVGQIEAHALQKQAILDQIGFIDDQRSKRVQAIAQGAGAPLDGLTLSKIAILAQGTNIKLGEQLRSVQQALSQVLTRVEEQGSYNRALVERSLEMLFQMKRNIVGAETSQAGTYSANGQKTGPTAGARLISREV